jgi:hydroxysqualene synthase
MAGQPIARTPALDAAYAHCLALARRHYENFPVASWLVPGRVRGPVAALYAFAREADDFADEPRHAGSRTVLLEDWSRRLEQALAGEASDPVFLALADTVRRFRLPPEPFRDLLSAFKQDACRSRYESWEEILDYCRRSANPVGRLILMMFGRREASLLPLSDSLCTALQLVNFWQDLAVDARRGRLYVPASDGRRHGVPEEALLSGEAVRLPGFRPLMDEMASRTLAFLDKGSGLPRRVGGRLGYELKLTWLGGHAVLQATRRAGFDVYASRPALGPAAWAMLLVRSCFSLPAAKGL